MPDKLPTNKPDDLDKEKESMNVYAKYSGVAFQMIAIIGVFTFIGYRLDLYYKPAQPYYTAGLALLGVCVSLYFVIRSVRSKSERD